MTLLEIEELSVCYGDFCALHGVNLAVPEGEVFACVGANGAGKSTLLRTIAGLLQAREGSILFDGKPIHRLPPHRRVDLGITLVPEGRQIFPSLTVRENLQIGAYRRRKGPWTIEAVLDMFPVLESRAKQRAGSLSGGEQQMLAIGRGLMSNPRLLLIDELSLGLAPLIVKRIYEAFPELLSAGCTLLLVEQDVRHVLTLAHQVACFLEGKVVLQGTPGEFTYEDLIRAYFGV